MATAHKINWSRDTEGDLLNGGSGSWPKVNVGLN